MTNKCTVNVSWRDDSLDAARAFFHTVYLNSKACVIASPAREMKYFNCQNLAVS